jgi:serine/threonine protein kinase
VKYGPWGTQYKLSDLGDSAPPNVPSNDGGHLIGAEIFCAPEVPLGIPWTTKADIWAVGATVRNLQYALSVICLIRPYIGHYFDNRKLYIPTPKCPSDRRSAVIYGSPPNTERLLRTNW